MYDNGQDFNKLIKNPNIDWANMAGNTIKNMVTERGGKEIKGIILEGK